MRPTGPDRDRSTIWTAAVYVGLTVIAVLVWFACHSDSATAAGGDPAGNAMSRAFARLLSMAAGIVSLALAAIALRVRAVEIKAVVLVAMMLVGVLLGAMI